MPHVEFVLPDLGYTAAAKQVSLVAPAMVRTEWSREVFPLTRAAWAGPFTDRLRANGVTVVESSARSSVRWLGLRFLIPAPGRGLVHAFGLPVLRRLRLATLGVQRPTIVLSLTGRERLGWLDRRCLRIVNRVLVPHSSAADALIGQGIPAGRITVVPPAVVLSDGESLGGGGRDRSSSPPGTCPTGSACCPPSGCSSSSATPTKTPTCS